jgi:deoxyxylulose-5-phosphate synthase
MSWEALNNIAASKTQKLVIVVNDNERSYSPTIGGLATYLSTLRATRGYEKFLDWGKEVLARTPVVGGPIYDTLHGMKKGIKDIVAPQGMFEDLGLKYLGPFDGHDIEVMEKALIKAKEFGGPILVHAITEKGRGYAPAIEDEAEKFHAVGIVDAETGSSMTYSNATTALRTLRDFSLIPIANSIEQRLSMPDFTPSSQVARMDFDFYLRGSSYERAQVYEILNRIGVMTADEIRQMEDMAL